MAVITLFGFGGVVGAVFLIGGSGPTAQPVDAPRPAPLPPPVPEPDTPEAEFVLVRFESEPSGASVLEADKILCSTPCDVKQWDYAPPTRNFVLKLDGYPDTAYQMTDPNQVQHVPLTRTGPRPAKPRPPSGRGEDLLPQR